MDALYRSSRPARLHRLNRRQVVLDLGWGGVAVAVLAGCSTGSTGSTGPGDATTSRTASSPAAATASSTGAQSVKTLAALDVGTILFGHGAPMTSGAAEALRTLAGVL